MPEKTKLKILEGLKQFEEGENYLKNNFSLPSLASKLNTNTKYLSIILNEYYNKDFNNYLNELRINYIIRKLKNNAQYRQYKLSYLAEKSGFSSHSKFSAVFKSITGFPPSDFIKFLESEGETI
jgi:YesN/AraC family two-component response regulator